MEQMPPNPLDQHKAMLVQMLQQQIAMVRAGQITDIVVLTLGPNNLRGHGVTLSNDSAIETMVLELELAKAQLAPIAIAKRVERQQKPSIVPVAQMPTFIKPNGGG